MTTNNNTHASVSSFYYTQLVVKAQKFQDEMMKLFAKVSGHNIHIEYNNIWVCLDRNDTRLYVWTDAIHERDVILDLKLMFSAMGFGTYISRNNLLEISGEGCNEEFNVEMTLKPIEAFLIYLETHNIAYEMNRFDDDCLPIDLLVFGGVGLFWYDICKNNKLFS